jgi:hypothetical protein
MPRMINSAESLFKDFLSGIDHLIKDYSYRPIEETGLADEFFKHGLRLTHFNDLYDTLMYSRLIEKALSYLKGPGVLIDFGAGSSVPSLLAVKNSPKASVSIKAIDIDPAAKEIGEDNATRLGLRGNYQFIQSSMEDILDSDLITSSPLVIASNPPYVATPPHVLGQHFVPINGGIDGSHYLKMILERDYPKGTLIALLWGSLTNPAEILPLMTSRYEILATEAMKIHFGEYTTNPLIKNHLYQLREQGKVYFEGEGESHLQLVIGNVLRFIGDA